jgi:hypothetical protein
MEMARLGLFTNKAPHWSTRAGSQVNGRLTILATTLHGSKAIEAGYHHGAPERDSGSGQYGDQRSHVSERRPEICPTPAETILGSSGSSQPGSLPKYLDPRVARLLAQAPPVGQVSQPAVSPTSSRQPSRFARLTIVKRGAGVPIAPSGTKAAGISIRPLTG